jgi:hypothetical protein
MDRCQVPHRSINNASPGLRFCDSVVHRLVTDTTRAYWDRTQRWLRAVLSCGLCCDTVRYCRQVAHAEYERASCVCVRRIGQCVHFKPCDGH